MVPLATAYIVLFFDNFILFFFKKIQTFLFPHFFKSITSIEKKFHELQVAPLYNSKNLFLK